MNQVELTTLLRNCNSGDVPAIVKFDEIFRPEIFRMALSILDDPAEADEAAQDTLLLALKSFHSFRGECKFTNWLYAITLNVCRGRLRKQRNRQRLMHILSDIFRMEGLDDRHPEEQSIRSEIEAHIWQAIQSLPHRLREVITLRYYHALPISEIAEILRVSERTVHYRLRNAHERLRGTLDERKLET
jgi:RNA polymerase sigma-70 factor (ECF subfamily)